MSLSICRLCKDSPKRFDILEIGIAEADTDYRVYITNLSTNIEQMYDVTSDANGVVQLRRADLGLDLAGGYHEIAIVDDSRYYINADDTITIDGVASSCLKVKFVDIVDADDTQVSFTYVRLVPA